MSKLKKVSIILIMIMVIGYMFTVKTYAALNCNVNLSTAKGKVTYGERFSVDVSISNLQTTKGIIAIGGVLSYDTNSLTLINFEGANSWSAPSYKTSNGKFTSLKNRLSTSNENVFKLTFEVRGKGIAKDSAWIRISNFEISDGDEENNCGGSSINVAIGEASSGNNPGGDNPGGDTPGGDNPGGNNQGGNNQGGSNQGGSNQGSSNQGGSSSSGNNQSGNRRPNTSTSNPTAGGSTSDQEDPNNQENPDDNTNSVENSVENRVDNDTENTMGNKVNNRVKNTTNNTVKNTVEKDTASKNKNGSKLLLYIVFAVVIVGLILVLRSIKKKEK